MQQDVQNASSKVQKFEEDIKRIEEQVEENPKIIKKQEIDKRMHKKQQSKNLIRYMNVIVDLTHTMKTVDLNPSRIGQTIQNLSKFVDVFFDKNPLSLLGIATVSNQICVQQIDFSSNSEFFKKQLLDPQSKLKEVQDKGHFSLQAIIEQQMRMFQDVPLHANKEVLIIQSSPSTVDTGDIFDAINRISKCRITVSIISLNSKTQVFNKLVQATGGQYNTIMNEANYWKLLKQYSEAPKYNQELLAKELVQVGFPSFISDTSLRLCACHQKFQTEFFECPNCKAKNCQIPSNCVVCKINLISPVHLARTLQHSSKLQSFDLIQSQQQQQNTLNDNGNSIQNGNNGTIQITCIGCNQGLNDQDYSKCKQCQSSMCLDCDIFIHDKLMICPGCH